MATYTGTLGAIMYVSGDTVIGTLFQKDTQMIELTWLNKDYQLSYNDFGLLFMFEARRDLFCNDPRSRIEVRLIDSETKINWDNYWKCLLVTGFPRPNNKHPLWDKELKATKHARGDANDGNARTVYLYVPDELGLGFSAGITVHNTFGSWSCSPGHEFEIEASVAPIKLLPDFTEKFAYITETNTAWGLHGNMPVGEKSTMFAIKDGDIVNVPLGTHFTVAMPGTRLAYVWALMGGGHKHYSK